MIFGLLEFVWNILFILLNILLIEIYKEVLYKDVSFPFKDEKFNNVNSFIRDLLTKKVNLRICNVF